MVTKSIQFQHAITAMHYQPLRGRTEKLFMDFFKKSNEKAIHKHRETEVAPARLSKNDINPQELLSVC